MKIYVSKINLFNNKEGVSMAHVEGIRYKKENETFTPVACSYYIKNYPVSWHTDIHTIPFKVEIRYNQDLKRFEVI